MTDTPFVDWLGKEKAVRMARILLSDIYVLRSEIYLRRKDALS